MKIRHFTLYVFIISLFIIEISIPRIAGVRPVNFVFVLLIAFLILYNKKIIVSHYRKLSKLDFIFLLYISWCLLSVFWSVDKLVTLFHSSLLFIFFIAVQYFRDINPNIVSRATVNIVILICLLSWGIYFIDPHIAVDRMDFWRLRGITIHEQRLALFVGIGILLLVILFLQIKEYDLNKYMYYIIVSLILLTTMFATQVRAFTVFAFVSIITMLLLSHKLKYKRYGYFTIGLLIALSLVFNEQLIEHFSRGDADLTLTGRTYIWAVTFNNIDHLSFFGYGFSTFFSSYFDHLWVGNYRPPHAHSTFINSYFETGLIGLFILLYFLSYTIKKSYYLLRNASGISITFSVFIYILLCGITGVIYGYNINPVLGISYLIAKQELA